jgi:hypothetical protein
MAKAATKGLIRDVTKVVARTWKRFLAMTLIVMLPAVALGVGSASVSADSRFAGNWLGQQTFCITSVWVGGVLPPEDCGQPVAIPLIVTSDGTLYTVGSTLGGLGLSGKIDANGNFNGSYSAQQGGPWPVTGTFSDGHASLAKQPVLPNGESGVNIRWDIVLTSTGPSNTNQTSSSSNNITPMQIVVGAVGGLAVVGATVGGIRRIKAATTKQETPRARRAAMGKKSKALPSVILQRGLDYSQPAPPTITGETPKIIEPEDATGGIPVGGVGATVIPPNEGRNVPVAVGATKRIIGLAGELPGVSQPDNNYAVSVTPSWQTSWDVPNETKSMSGFVITFGTPAPSDATIDWKIVRHDD